MNTKTQIILAVTMAVIMFAVFTASVAAFCTVGDTTTEAGCFTADSAHANHYVCVERLEGPVPGNYWQFVRQDVIPCGSDSCGGWEYYVNSEYNVYAERTMIKRDCFDGRCVEEINVEKKTFGNIINDTVMPFYDERPTIHIGDKEQPKTQHL